MPFLLPVKMTINKLPRFYDTIMSVLTDVPIIEIFHKNVKKGILQ